MLAKAMLNQYGTQPIVLNAANSVFHSYITLHQMLCNEATVKDGSTPKVTIIGSAEPH